MTKLVVLPGLDGTATLHAQFVEAVRPSFDRVAVVAYPSDQIMSYRELEEFARDSLPQDKFILLGESFSGPIAISLAASKPQGLIGVVLSTTFARRPLPFLSGFAGLVRVAPIHSFPDWMLAYLLLGPWSTPELVSSIQRALGDVAPEVLRARVAASMRVDVSAHLTEIDVPILYLRATNDRLLPSTAAQEIAAKARELSVREVRGPHL